MTAPHVHLDRALVATLLWVIVNLAGLVALHLPYLGPSHSLYWILLLDVVRPMSHPLHLLGLEVREPAQMFAAWIAIGTVVSAVCRVRNSLAIGALLLAATAFNGMILGYRMPALASGTIDVGWAISGATCCLLAVFTLVPMRAVCVTGVQFVERLTGQRLP